MRELDERAHGQEVALTVGETFRIRLAENPTTGFRWTLESSGEPVCAVISQAYEPEVGPPGQGGSHYWELRAVQAGSGTLELVYRRSWEPATPSARRLTLRLQVLG